MIPVSSIIQQAIVVDMWTIIAAIATVLGTVIAFIALFPQFRSRAREQVLRRHINESLYDKETIKRATRYYIEPDCTDMDPNLEPELRKSHIIQNNLFDAVDRFLDDQLPNKHLLILADSGMGKTSFVLNYYAKSRSRLFRRDRRIAIVPLGIPDVEAQIAKIDRPKETFLFLDAFDEDTKAIQNHHERIIELMRLCRSFKRVVVTCRTQFFLSDQEIVDKTGVVRVGPVSMGEKREYEFMKLYVSPFDDRQVDVYLKKRYRFKRRLRKKAKEVVANVKSLSVRPMLLAYIPDLIEAGASINNSADIYEEMIRAWADRESGFWENPDELIAFSSQLATDIYTRRAERKQEKVDRKELLQLADGWGYTIEGWKLTGRSLLNRDAVGNSKFAHRSIMEYMIAKEVVKEPGSFLEVKLTEQIQRFVLELSGIDASRYRTEDELAPGELTGSFFLEFKEKDTPLAKIALNAFLARFAQIPQGEFIMGDEQGEDDEKPEHAVFLSEYWISKNPVTNKEYYQFVIATDHDSHPRWRKASFGLDQPNHPVTSVSWDDAVAYANWLSQKTGLAFSLPTEAQWEKAARGTDSRRYPWGDDWDSSRSNSHEGGIGDTTEVGVYSPRGDSPYGVSDMAGNVWEWCLDWYSNNTYSDRPGTICKDPEGPPNGNGRVLRGGAFNYDQNYCRSSYRNYNNPNVRDDNIGFRLVLRP